MLRKHTKKGTNVAVFQYNAEQGSSSNTPSSSSGMEQHQNTVRLFCDLAADTCAAMQAQQLVNTMHNLHALQWTHPPLLQALVQRAADPSAALTGEQLAQVMWCCGRINTHLPPIKSIVQQTPALLTACAAATARCSGLD
jgi:hypothetical protein